MRLEMRRGGNGSRTRDRDGRVLGRRFLIGGLVGGRRGGGC